MMNEYFLSSHASVNAQHKIMVPDGCMVKFYVPEGQALDHNRAFAIFINLVKQVTPGGKVDHVFKGGDFIPNYTIWDLWEYSNYSGVYHVGSDHPSVHLNTYSENKPLTQIGRASCRERV